MQAEAGVYMDHDNTLTTEQDASGAGARSFATQEPRVPDAAHILREIEAASAPDQLREIEAKLEGFEAYMKQTGLYSTAQIRPFNEARMLARWKLGQLLSKMERAKPRPGGKTMSRPETQFREFIKSLGLDKARAQEAQRIGTLPRTDLDKAFADAKENDVLTTFTRLIDVARPYWHKERRAARHREIADNATNRQKQDSIGPFALIYADPPWEFETYSDRGLGRSPERHYPVMTDDEIAKMKIGGSRVREIVAADAGLLLWCTSPTLQRAFVIMEAWGFSYRASAVWDKGNKIGMGFTFRNQHEFLLLGARGNFPAPVFKPGSIFRFDKTKHSAKPPEIRKIIEKMYPAFSQTTRLEMFARGKIAGWSVYGFEAE
jgi:N6-adenosine-specific RNA methylase IME4